MELANIHHYLGEQRKKQTLAQRDIAEALNVEQATISYYETGKRSIPLDLLDRWLQLLGIEVKFTPKDCKPVRAEDETQQDLNTFHDLKRKRNYLIAELRAKLAEKLVQVPEFQNTDKETGEGLFWPYSLRDNEYVGLIETRYDHPQQKYLAVEYTHEEVNVYRFLNIEETYDGVSKPVWRNADRIYYTEDDFLTHGGEWDPKSMEMRKMTILRKNADRPNDVDIIDPEGFPLRALVQMHENYYRFAEVVRELETQNDYMAMKQELETVRNELVSITFDNRLWNGAVNPEFEFWSEADKDAIDVPLCESPRSWSWIEEGVEWVEKYLDAQERVLLEDSKGPEHYHVLKEEDNSHKIVLIQADREPDFFEAKPHRPHMMYRAKTDKSTLYNAKKPKYKAALAPTRRVDGLMCALENSRNEE